MFRVSEILSNSQVNLDSCKRLSNMYPKTILRPLEGLEGWDVLKQHQKHVLIHLHLVPLWECV